MEYNIKFNKIITKLGFNFNYFTTKVNNILLGLVKSIAWFQIYIFSPKVISKSLIFHLDYENFRDTT